MKRKTTLWSLLVVYWLSTSAASAIPITEPVIWEIFYDDLGSDGGSDRLFIEILVGSKGIEPGLLRVEALNGADGKVYASLDLADHLVNPLPAWAVVLIASAPISAAQGVVVLVDPFVDLQNGPDSLRLVNAATGSVLDLVGYGASLEPGLYERQPAADAPAGWSLSRSWDTGDTNDNGHDFRIVEPTPGTIVTVPEPSCAVLFGFALLGLTVGAKRRRRTICSRVRGALRARLIASGPGALPARRESVGESDRFDVNRKRSCSGGGDPRETRAVY